MPSLPDGIVIFILALLLFGPKKLPSLARELGKWIGEFRRASNEFKMQMEEEMRLADMADREKQITTLEASAPTAALPGVPTEEPEHPHVDPFVAEEEAATKDTPAVPPAIATEGELSIMPPATGLPTPRGATTSSDVGSVFDSIPVAEPTSHHDLETSTHG
jgi:sec-independent protein translocase protein TatB